MYTKPRRIYTDISGMENYIEGTDVYNSKLLYLLSDPGLKTENYVIKTPYRTDIIAKEFYGDEKYESFVIFQLKISIGYLLEGTRIELISKEQLESILSNKID